MNISTKLKEKIEKIQFIAFDFDGVFTDNLVYTSETGEETVSCWRSDGLGLSKIKEISIPIWVISTETNPVVSERCKKLGIDHIQGCNNKLESLKKLISKFGVTLAEVAYVGNDINDRQCLKQVCLPIVVADAHIDVLDLGQYITKASGGRGAVREVCDLIYNVKYTEGDL
jgi:3-deoxy-D-manno-octulosonate 8-phosphate phosphatase (KDO 8-P phosphatase)